MFDSAKCMFLWLLQYEIEMLVTCWLFSVLIENAEMSNKALKINPNGTKIHIIWNRQMNIYIREQIVRNSLRFSRREPERDARTREEKKV